MTKEQAKALMALIGNISEELLVLVDSWEELEAKEKLYLAQDLNEMVDATKRFTEKVYWIADPEIRKGGNHG